MKTPISTDEDLQLPKMTARVQKNGFDVEDDKKHGDNIKPDRKALALRRSGPCRIRKGSFLGVISLPKRRI